MDSSSTTSTSKSPKSSPLSVEEKIANIDSMLKALDSNKDKWAAFPFQKRLVILKHMLEKVHSLGSKMADASAIYKGITLDSHPQRDALFGDELAEVGTVVLRALRLTIMVVEPLAKTEAENQKLKASGKDLKPYKVTAPKMKKIGDRWIADILPLSTSESLLLAGVTGQVWMKPNTEPTQASQLFRSHKAAVDGEKVKHDPGYDDSGPLLPSRSNGGTVSVVLGAGNTNAIGITDVLYKMFVENSVCLFKHNPVAEYMAPFFDIIMEPLMKLKFFFQITGGIPEGAFISSHPLVDTLHITGSHVTHNIIRYGLGAEQKSRITADKPLNSKRFTSELGCVTPCIICPSRRWTEKELIYQAERYAASVSRNGAFLCVSSKCLIFPSKWDQKDIFLKKVSEILNSLYQFPNYYPGSRDRYNAFMKTYKSNKITKYGKLPPKASENKYLPYTIIHDLDSTKKAQLAFQTEAFATISCTIPIESAANPDEFLPKAVEFCNNTLHGNLSCWMIADPDVEKNHSPALNKAIEDLHYGGVGINCWSSLCFATMGTPWGAYPGNPYNNVSSGRGSVHNVFMFDNVEKGVIRGPWILFSQIGGMRPPWFSTHRNRKLFFEAYNDFEYNGSVGSLLSTVWQSLFA